jgi:hypothetical protein
LLALLGPDEEQVLALGWIEHIALIAALPLRAVEWVNRLLAQ